MADAEQYYQGLSEDHKRIYFSQRYYSEKVAALEAKIAELQNRLSGHTPADSSTTEELAVARERIATLESRVAELTQPSATPEAAGDAVKEDAKEDSKQAARKTKGRKKGDADNSDAEGG